MTEPERRARRAARLVTAGTLVLLVGAWQIAAGNHMVSGLILPPPMDVVRAFGDGVIGGMWFEDILVTLEETILGFALGLAAALVLGAVFAYAQTLRRGLYPYLLALQTFPKIAIAPLLVAWLGYGMAPKVLISALLAFFPVYANTLAGFLEIDPAMVDLLHAMRATRWQELRALRLPNAVAFIVPSLDVALVLALLGAIAGELTGATAGLGNVITQRTFLGDSAAVYAVLILLAATGLLCRAAINAAISAIRRFRPGLAASVR